VSLESFQSIRQFSEQGFNPFFLRLDCFCCSFPFLPFGRFVVKSNSFSSILFLNMKGYVFATLLVLRGNKRLFEHGGRRVKEILWTGRRICAPCDCNGATMLQMGLCCMLHLLWVHGGAVMQTFFLFSLFSTAKSCMEKKIRFLFQQ
jgi:hypothetical protein